MNPYPWASPRRSSTSTGCPRTRCSGCPEPLWRLRRKAWSPDPKDHQSLDLLIHHVAWLLRGHREQLRPTSLWGRPITSPMRCHDPGRLSLLDLGTGGRGPRLAITPTGDLRESRIPFRKVRPSGPVSLPGHDGREVFEALGAIARTAHRETGSPPPVLQCLEETLERLWCVGVVLSLRRRTARRGS